MVFDFKDVCGLRATLYQSERADEDLKSGISYRLGT